MKLDSGRLVISATDLSNYLACDHLTELNRQIAVEGLKLSYYQDPVLEILRQRGYEHEALYVKHLEMQGLKVIDLKNKPKDETMKAMRAGFDVIVQARFENTEWKGFPDILLKVNTPSKLGTWSYQVQDTKLSQHTRAGTILQLCFYSEFLESIQGTAPELMYVIKPGDPFIKDQYRYTEFKAYYTLVKQGLLNAAQTPQQTYPEPVEHCNICSYWQLCAQQRRDDDHLSLVAGIRTAQIVELQNQHINTLTTFARTPELKKPERGDFETLKKKQDQAKIQLEGIETKKLLYRFLPVPKKEKDPKPFTTTIEHGFNMLPEPSEGDIYFDFEGDAFYEGGILEYLFGYVYKNERKEWVYSRIWARNRQEEKLAFQQFVEFVMSRWKKYPSLCIYHFAPYEPSALKRLMRTHGLYEKEVNKILRGLRFVDLHSVIKRSLIASVERYSLKDLEHLALFTRTMPLQEAGAARRQVECALELGDFPAITAELQKKVDDYNEDDCRATLALHLWIEERRREQVKGGVPLTRLEITDGDQEEDQKKRAEEIERIVNLLIKGLPEDRNDWTEEDKAKWLLSH
jgi:predicted RecB family nuclease